MKKWVFRSSAFLIILGFVLGILHSDKQVKAASDSIVVTTQMQLASALSNSDISTITIQPQKTTSFSIPEGSYDKNLNVYQTYTTLTNNGSFNSLNVIAVNQTQINKALRTKNISALTMKAISNLRLILTGSHEGIDLIVDAKKCTITNKASWHNIRIDNSYTWSEEANGNVITLNSSSGKLTLKKNYSIEEVQVNSSQATLTLKADGTIGKITVLSDATINLSGSSQNSILNSFVKSDMNATVTVNTVSAVYTVTTDNQIQISPSEVEETHVHKYTESISKAATCVTAGTKKFTCECGDTYTEVIPATGHDEGVWYEQKATTAYNGIKVRACTKCGTILEFIQIPKLAPEHIHSYTIITTSPSTCTQNGSTTYTCTCDANYSEIIQASGHTLGDWEVETEATTTSTGRKVQKCSVCHAVINQEVIPKVNDPNTVNGHELITVTIDMGNGKTKDVVGYYDYEMANEVFDKLNELRVSKGQKPLAWNLGMAPSADVRAAEVSLKFDHYRPNGEYCYYIYPTMSSENIAMGYTSAYDVMTGWINSTAHYNAMVKADYKSVSISCFMYELYEGTWIGGWSMLFSKYPS